MKTLVIIAAFLIGPLSAAPVTLAWDANPPEQAITSYRLDYGRPPEAWKQLTVGNGATTATLNLEPGEWTFTVRAINERGLHSPDSEPITYKILVPPTAPKGLRVVLTLQSSTTGKDWQDRAVHHLDESEPVQLYRLAVTTTR